MLRAALLLSCTFLFFAGPAVAQQILLVDGPVEIGSGEPPSWRPARVGDAVQPGDAIRTGYQARAELDLGSGKVKLYENSLLRVPGSGIDKHGHVNEVEQEEGTSIFDIIKRKAGQGEFKVRTPEAVVMVKGTSFAVSLNAGVASVSVFHGLVGVKSFERPEVMVRPGLTAVGGRNQPFELKLHDLKDTDVQQDWDKGEAPSKAPESAMAPEAPPASAAKAEIAEAKQAARAAAEPAFLAQLIKRNPAAKAQYDQAMAKAEKNGENGNQGPPGAPGANGPGKKPLALASLAKRDPVNNAQGIPDFKGTLKNKFAEKTAQTFVPGGADGAPPFNVQFDGTNGKVRIFGLAGGEIGSGYDHGNLATAVGGLSTSVFPIAFQNIITTDANREAFAQHLINLYFPNQ